MRKALNIIAFKVITNKNNYSSASRTRRTCFFYDNLGGDFLSKDRVECIVVDSKSLTLIKSLNNLNERLDRVDIILMFRHHALENKILNVIKCLTSFGNIPIYWILHLRLEF